MVQGMKNDSSVYSVKILTELAIRLWSNSFALKQQNEIAESNKLLKSLVFTYWMSFNIGNTDAAFALYERFKEGFDDVKPNLDIAHIFFGVAKKLGDEDCNKETVPEHALKKLETQINTTFNRFKIANDIIQDNVMSGEGLNFFLAKYYVCIVLPNGNSLAEAMLAATHPAAVRYFVNDVSQFSSQSLVHYCLGDTKCTPKVKQALDNLLNDDAQDDMQGYQSSALEVTGESTTGYGTGTATDKFVGDNNPGCCCILM